MVGAFILVRVVMFALLCSFLWGCGNPNDQRTNTRSDDAASVAKVRTNEAVSPQTGLPIVPESTNTPFNGTLAPSSGDLPAGPNANNFDLPAIIHLSAGTTYQGETKAGKPNGQGILTEESGTRQVGEWRDGNPYKLSGTYVYPDGTKEIGTWNYDGTKSGGKIAWRDGRIYQGDWTLVDGVPDWPDGTGEMTWPDGRKYVGQFRDGKMYGPGKMTYPNGKVENGSWKDDKFLGPAH